MRESVKKSMIRAVVCGWLLAAAFVFVPVSFPFTGIVHASETSVTGSIFEAKEPMDAYSAKDSSAQIVHSFAQGDIMLLLSEDEEWYEIFWQGERAYISKTGKLPEQKPIEEVDMEKLAEEAVEEALKQQETSDAAEPGENFASEDMTALYDEGTAASLLEKEAAAIQDQMIAQQMAFEEAEAAKKKAVIWRIIMVVLVLAIIAVSLVPVIIKIVRDRKNAEADGEEEETAGDGKDHD